MMPVVVLLGPTGAGKTEALNSISRDYGAGVVHARFDFDRTEPVSTIEILASIAFDLSRRWKARRAARFTRFTLGVVAVQTPLDGLTREQAKDKLQASIQEITRSTRAEKLAAATRTLIDSAQEAGILDVSVARTIGNVLPGLIESVGRRPLSKAKNWHSDIPEAEGASAIDALVSLNRRAREQPAEATDWLTAAFLADVREDHPRMATADEGSVCPCTNPDKLRHWHNWGLLLDNLDHAAGATFLADLLAARERHLQRDIGDHDPLLIIGTSGRWNTDWEYGWRPPWHPEPGQSSWTRAVPSCQAASYEHWVGQSDTDRPPPRHYPVLLEPLDVDETARILGTGRYNATCVLAQRATGGLPAAVHELKPQLRQLAIRPGTRDLLVPAGHNRSDPWHARLKKWRITDQLPDIEVEEFVTAAPFATAPWLLSAKSSSLISRPQVGRILTELRTALWITAPADGGGVPNHAELHPWIAGTLVSALAYRDSDPPFPSYTRQFEALLEDRDTFDDPTRRAYCQLALGRIGEVVDAFTASFDQDPHQAWIDRLRLVTRAPNSMPLDRDGADLYTELVEADIRHAPTNRSPVRNIVTRLVAASWLYHDPFAMPDKAQRAIMAKAYAELAPLSQRPDVAALHTAATLAADALR
jgi:hypothetical protein